MPSHNYWIRRFELLEEAQHSKGAAYLADVEREFRKHAVSLDEKIGHWYQRFAENDQISLADAKKSLNARELKELKWDVQEYIRYGKKNALDGRWIKELENASARVHVTRLEAMKLQLQQQVEVLYGGQLDGMDKLARRVYSEGYYNTAFEIQKGFNVGWDLQPLNSRRIERALSKPWTADGQTFSDRIWTQKRQLLGSLQTELTQAFIRGDTPEKAIKAITQQFGVSKNKAPRLVMTETAFFTSESQRDCFEELDVKEYKIIATLDEVTSDICQALDGKVFLLADFVAGVTAPPFHPWCRSITVPHFDDDYGKRVAIREDGSTYHVPSDMKYEEWKKLYVDGGSKDKDGSEAPITPFVPAKSVKQAEEYAAKELGIPGVSYKGCDVSTANEWNRGLQDSFARFPELKDSFRFVGECHQRNEALKPAAREYFLAQLKERNPSRPVEALEPYAQSQLKQFMKRMAVGKNTFAQSWSPQTEAFRPFRGITVNRDWGKDSTMFADALQDNVTSKFHPVGCDTIRSVLDHEIGHQLDNLLGIGDLPEVKNLFDKRTRTELTDALSRYAWDNQNANRYSEMIAEAWAEYCNNPDPREIAKEIGECIEQAYRKKYKAR